MLDERSKKIVKDLAIENGLSVQQVEDIKNSIFKFIFTKTKEFNIADYRDWKDVQELKSTFNVPKLGKFFISKATFEKYITLLNKKINNERKNIE
jgi:hypothetical protein